MQTRLEELHQGFQKFETQQKEKRKLSNASVQKQIRRMNAFLDSHPDFDERLKVKKRGIISRISYSRFKKLIGIGKNASRAIWHAGDFHILPAEVRSAYDELRKIDFSSFL